MTPSIRILAAIACLWIAVFAAPVAAQSFPQKPIKWIVPFPPGGPTDSFSRPVAQKLSEILGQPVVVENIPGAGASIGMDRIAKSPADGYTIGLATTGTHSINPHLFGARLPHDTSRDFTPLTLAVRYINVLVVNPRLGINSVGDLVAYAKANPGKVTFGSAGNGSSNHLSGEALKYVTGAPMQHIPYRGSAPALADVIGGNITFMFDSPVTAMPSVRAGRVKALAVSGDLLCAAQMWLLSVTVFTCSAQLVRGVPARVQGAALRDQRNVPSSTGRTGVLPVFRRWRAAAKHRDSRRGESAEGLFWMRHL